MNVHSLVQDSLQSLVDQHVLLPFDIAFAQKHLSQKDSPPQAEAFLAVASALLRCGYPYFSIHEEAMSPTLPGITNRELFQWFQALPREVKTALFEVVNEKIYLRPLFLLREQVFQKLQVLVKAIPRIPLVFEEIPQLSEEQNRVLKNVLNSCFSLVCGGPGTGKTFLAVQMIRLVLSQIPSAQIVVASPTGKASTHLHSVLTSQGIIGDSVEVVTIHKFLKDTRNGRSPADLLLVDEGSMVTMNLLHGLIKTIRGEYRGETVFTDRIVVFGDANQLPPIGIGVGNPFREIVSGFSKQTFSLSTCHRAKHKELQELAYAVLQKQPIPFQQLPSRREAIRRLSTAFMRAAEEGVSLCVLTPMRQGPWGFLQLNQLLFNEMQEHYPQVSIPIMVTERYETWGLTNGDTGVLDPLTHKLCFMNGEILQKEDFPHYSYNYVMSVHKSQGSEYDRVIIIFPKGSEAFDSAILYTAITRTKQHVEIWADRETLDALILKKGRY
ncbi:exodeoxyribonuclease V subunit alpha [Chlamydia sp.]|uniref:exodeoxyribonuclease V subunit alpha n=1 Tax=Chlamydia sp. TaxID=35827 RepID=UPI0025BE73A3|nr:exodeoxyribonuclease V subunit alpha [Chlamydia sp.]MBQ8498853.1 exodeoxyribonuclease V subunit alpha [Chlamydia sp.]